MQSTQLGLWDRYICMSMFNYILIYRYIHTQAHVHVCRHFTFHFKLITLIRLKIKVLKIKFTIFNLQLMFLKQLPSPRVSIIGKSYFNIFNNKI